MQIDHVSFSASGGAGKVALALQEAQVRQGHDALLHTLIEKDLKRQPFRFPSLTVRAAIDEFMVSSHSETTSISFARSKTAKLRSDHVRSESIINFHWIEGVVKPEQIKEYLKLGRKVVWTLHDMAPITSVCHHSHSCEGFKDNCNGCPQVRLPFRSAVRNNLSIKAMPVTFPNLVAVAPTRWLAKKASESSVFARQRILTIPNPIDECFFKVRSEAGVKNFNKLNSKFEFTVVAVAADLSNPAKGISAIIEVFVHLRKTELSFKLARLLVVGNGGQKFHSPADNIYWVGELCSQGISDTADEGDVLVSMSHAESAGLTIREFGARGVPSIVLDRGGAQEMLLQNRTGNLISSPQDLAKLLLRYRLNPELATNLGKAAAILALENSPDYVAKQYLATYSSLL